MAFVLDEVKDDPEFKKFIDSTVSESVSKATDELKNKNSELLGEKKKLQEMMSKLDGIDPEAARKALEFMDNNEVAKLLADGKAEEALASHTEKLTAKYQERIDALTEDLNKTKDVASSFKSRFETSVIDTEVQKLAAKEGILPDAMEDVIFRARSIFSYGEDGSIEARDKDGALVKVEEKILTPELWVKNLPRHYWPSSDGVGASGGQKGDGDAQLADAASSGDMAKYRKLRSKK